MALDDRHRVHANSFGAVADVYERGRPQYPPAALDWLVPAQATRVTLCSRADLPGRAR